MSTATLAPVEAPIWEGWSVRGFMANLHHNYNGGGIYYTNDFIKLPEMSLGEWKWRRCVISGSRRLDLTMNWDAPEPKYHAPMGREAAAAHMMMHIEDGTQCSGADPQEWGAYERDLDTRAMARMGWTSWRAQDVYDVELGRMVPWEPETQRSTSHVAKSELRRRSAKTSCEARVASHRPRSR